MSPSYGSGFLQKWFIPFSLASFAIAIQIQLTFFETQNYLGIRLSLADLLLPVVGVVILISLLMKRSVWPYWQRPFGYWVFVLLSCVFGFALLNGYFTQGEWSGWALYNKGLGWLVLIAYYAAGAWFSSNGFESIRQWFLVPLLAFLCFICVIEIFFGILFFHNVIEKVEGIGSLFAYDLSGLMANRNAFIFLLISVMALASVRMLYADDFKGVEAKCYYFMWFLMPSVLAFNLSRTSLGLLIPLMLFIAFKNIKVFGSRILLLILAGLLIIPFTNLYKLGIKIDQYQTLSYVYNSIFDHKASSGLSDLDNSELYLGDHRRFETYSESWELYKARPLTGSGLGATLHYQAEQGREMLFAVDNTLLWILTEMGPFGLLSFVLVYVAMLVALRRKAGKLKEPHEIFSYGVIFILIGFGLFSMLHEILYSRFLWFFLGLGLAWPVSKQPAGEKDPAL